MNGSVQVYIVLVEMKIQSCTKGVESWFVLRTIMLPFVPTRGLWIKTLQVEFMLHNVCWDVAAGLFRATTAVATLEEEQNTEEEAAVLVKVAGWEKAVSQSSIEQARLDLAKEVVQKLRSQIIQPVRIDPHTFGKRGG